MKQDNYKPPKRFGYEHMHAVGEKSEITTFDIDVLDFPPPAIHFKEKRFVFTGNLIYGSRAQCAHETREQGGLVDKNITRKTDYLVIGVQADDKWKHGNKGGKIQKAMEYRDRPDCNIKIVSGIAFATWLKAYQLGRITNGE